MRGLSAHELLEIWEQGRHALPIERAWLLLEAALPIESGTSAADWSIGRRDAALLELRRDLFGDAMTCTSTCTRCGGALELALSTTELLCLHDARDRHHADGAEDVAPVKIEVMSDGRPLRARLPTTADVLAVTRAGGGSDALIARCLDGEPPAGIGPETLEALASAMSAADPLADLEINGECPVCRESWSAPFDITAFLWAELEAWALGVLHEVHVLATAYGWSETQILTLSPARRAAYLELVGV